MSRMTPEGVLYYPTIEVVDEGWLKNALCIWEHVYRIVPHGYSPNDSTEVRLAVEAGLVRDVSLSPEDLSEAADSFESFLSRVPFVPAGIGGGREEAAHLFEQKIDSRLLPKLRELAAKVNTNGRLQLSKRLADGYMMFLAETVARRRCMPKMTDDEDIYSAMQYYENDGNMREQLYDLEAEEFSATLVIPTALPGGTEFIPMKDFVRLREKQRTGRQAFRSAVASLADSAIRIDDEIQQARVVQDFAKKYEAVERDRTRELKEVFGELKYSLFCVGFPVSMTALGTFAPKGDLFDLATVCGSVSIGAVAALSDVMLARHRRERWTSSEGGYYLQLQQLGSATVGEPMSVPRFDRLLEEFVND